MLQPFFRMLMTEYLSQAQFLADTVRWPGYQHAGDKPYVLWMPDDGTGGPFYRLVWVGDGIQKGLGRILRFPRALNHVWGSGELRWSTGFVTYSGGPRNPPNPDHKTLFYTVTDLSGISAGAGRFEQKWGVFGTGYALGAPQQLVVLPNGKTNGPPTLSMVADGQWHRNLWEAQVKVGGDIRRKYTAAAVDGRVTGFGEVNNAAQAGPITGMAWGSTMNCAVYVRQTLDIRGWQWWDQSPVGQVPEWQGYGSVFK